MGIYYKNKYKNNNEIIKEDNDLLPIDIDRINYINENY